MAIRIEITDPDRDDQADAKLKTRSNGDGTMRSVLESDIFNVEAGRQYILRVTLLDLITGQESTVETPPMVAQPPR